MQSVTLIKALGISARSIRMTFVHFNEVNQGMSLAAFVNNINFNFPWVYRCKQRYFFDQSERSKYLDYFISSFQLLTRKRKRNALEKHLHIQPVDRVQSQTSDIIFILLSTTFTGSI